MTAPLDLAARSLGGSVLAASDESFGSKEFLLREAEPSFEPGHYDHRGEIVDGWETRRRRSTQTTNLNAPQDSCDWVIVRLGAAGVISSVDVNTRYFTGNHPAEVGIEALGAEGYPSVAELVAAPWTKIVARQSLAGDISNLIPVTDPTRYTHIRLRAYPDGGIARLRVYGTVIPDPRWWDGVTVEVSAISQGGMIGNSSNDFYTSAHALLRPDSPRTMGEGWETRRRRGGGQDSVDIALAAPTWLQQVTIDTTHFKYNASAAVRLWALDGDTAGTRELLQITELQPDTVHRFRLTDPVAQPVQRVRLEAFPDGGLARVRLFGRVSVAGRRAAGLRWLESLPREQAAVVLSAAGAEPAGPDPLVQVRALPDDDPVRVQLLGRAARSEHA